MQAFIVCIHLVLHSPHLPLLHTGAGTDDCAISSILAISAPLPNCPYLAGELITIGKACRRDPVTNRIETDYARMHEEVGCLMCRAREHRSASSHMRSGAAGQHKLCWRNRCCAVGLALCCPCFGAVA